MLKFSGRFSWLAIPCRMDYMLLYITLYDNTVIEQMKAFIEYNVKYKQLTIHLHWFFIEY